MTCVRGVECPTTRNKFEDNWIGAQLNLRIGAKFCEKIRGALAEFDKMIFGSRRVEFNEDGGAVEDGDTSDCF